jgi:hypothetical protein
VVGDQSELATEEFRRDLGKDVGDNLVGPHKPSLGTGTVRTKEVGELYLLTVPTVLLFQPTTALEIDRGMDAFRGTDPPNRPRIENWNRISFSFSFSFSLDTFQFPSSSDAKKRRFLAHAHENPLNLISGYCPFAFL